MIIKIIKNICFSEHFAYWINGRCLNNSDEHGNFWLVFVGYDSVLKKMCFL